MISFGFFKLARNASTFSNYRYRVGAVIVKKKPLGVGFNSIKTHTKYSNKYLTTVHAEMSALIHTKLDDLKGASIYVYREDRNGFPAMARPCENCLIELKKRGLRKMYYTTNEYPYFNMEKI